MSVTRKGLFCILNASKYVIRPAKPNFLNKHSLVPSSYSTRSSESACPFASLAHQAAKLACSNLGSSSSISLSFIFLICLILVVG